VTSSSPTLSPGLLPMCHGIHHSVRKVAVGNRTRRTAVSSNIEPNGDFIEQWINARKTEAELDQRILSLIDQHRKGAALDEAGLFKSLIALSEEPEDKNGSD